MTGVDDPTSAWVPPAPAASPPSPWFPVPAPAPLPPAPADDADPAAGERFERGTGLGHLILPVVAVLVLVVGIAVAAGGVGAKLDADDSADAATASLPVATAARDEAQEASDDAAARSVDAAARRARAVSDAQVVRDGGDRAAGLADELVACDQRLIDATNDELAALEVEDYGRADRAVDTYNAAVGECETASLAYLAAVDELYGVDSNATRTA